MIAEKLSRQLWAATILLQRLVDEEEIEPEARNNAQAWLDPANWEDLSLREQLQAADGLLGAIEAIPEDGFRLSADNLNKVKEWLRDYRGA